MRATFSVSGFGNLSVATWQVTTLSQSLEIFDVLHIQNVLTYQRFLIYLHLSQEVVINQEHFHAFYLQLSTLINATTVRSDELNSIFADKDSSSTIVYPW